MESKLNDNAKDFSEVKEKIKKTKKENETTKAVPLETKEDMVFVYVGPNDTDKLLSYGRIYKNIPDNLMEFIQNNSAIGKCFISVNELAEFNSKVGIKGTMENKIFNDAKKSLMQK